MIIFQLSQHAPRRFLIRVGSQTHQLNGIDGFLHGAKTLEILGMKKHYLANFLCQY